MPAGRPFRIHERRVVRLAVSVEHAAHAWQREARVVNVGLGGACVELGPTLGAGPVDVSTGDQVTLGFLAPSLWDPLPVRARVAWVRPRVVPGAPPPPGLGPGAGRMLAAAFAVAQSDPLRFGVAFEHEGPSAVLALFELVAQMDYE